MRWLPNLLTGIRIALTPLLGWLIATGRCGDALLLSAVAGFTDALDGFLARRFGWMTLSGAYLDPVADKLMLVTVYLALGAGAIVPRWLVWIVVGRDVLILAMVGAAFAFTQIRDFPPAMTGKVSTTLQIAGALVFLSECAAFPGMETAKPLAVFAVAAGTIVSGLHYIWRGFRMALGPPR